MIFNYQPAKIFMGDSGSMLLGLINSILVIKFITVADSADMVYRVESSAAAVGFAILMVPLLDTLRGFSIRIFRGKSPFTPDRNHIHHLLLDLKMSHTAVTITCVGVNLMFIAMAFLRASLGTTKIILLLLLTAFCIIGFLFYWKTRIKPALLKSKEETDFKPATKVVALTQETSAVEQN